MKHHTTWNDKGRHGTYVRAFKHRNLLSLYFQSTSSLLPVYFKYIRASEGEEKRIRTTRWFHPSIGGLIAAVFRCLCPFSTQ